MNVTVITPTTGMSELAQGIKSVAVQKAEHLVIVDGVQHAEKTIKIVQENGHPNLRVMIVPENTGIPARHFNAGYTGAFYGHRVYAAATNLINTKYVMFLDEDNWFEPNHVETMLNAMEKHNLQWCYSLRKVVDKDGNFICEDNCDSLGIYPNQEKISFADMNCYCFQTEFLLPLLLTFQTPTYNCDRILFRKAVAASRESSSFGSTGKYTVNYRANRKEQIQWFLDGNTKMHEIYKTFPWRIE